MNNNKELTSIPPSGYVCDKIAAVALGIKVRTVRWRGQNGMLSRRAITVRGGTSYEYLLDNAAIVRYTEMQNKSTSAVTPLVNPDIDDQTREQEILDAMTEWQRQHVMHLQTLLLQTKGLIGSDLKAFLKQYSEINPENSYSLGHFYAIKADYEKKGLVALIPKWGVKTKGNSTVADDVFAIFKRAYLTERQTSPHSCWKLASGYAEQQEASKGQLFDLNRFPSVSSFMRRLNNDIPKTVIKRARLGYEAWKRTDGLNLNRDYGDLLAGEVWVGDHFETDNHVIMPNGKTGRLWVTGWMDFRTCKFVGWKISVDGPTTSNILIAFKRGAEKHGIPSDVYLDNGRDYRSRTLQGGGDGDDDNVKGLFASLNINVHFAGIRKAQSKTIERMHGRIHREFDRLFRGYCGINISSKPEALANEIKTRNLRTVEQFERDFDTFILEVFNKTISNGNTLKGMSPNQLWDMQIQQAFNENKVHKISPNALRMFCTQVYAPRQIRNSCYMDSKLRLKYYQSWMATLNGHKVIMRRDDGNVLIAWFFDAKTGDYLGEAETMEFTSALARTPLARQAVSDQIKVQRGIEKLTKELGKVDPQNEDELIPLMVAHIKAVDRARNHQPIHQQITTPVQITDMDRVAAEENRRKKLGTYDNILIVPEKPKPDEWMDELEFLKAVSS